MHAHRSCLALLLALFVVLPSCGGDSPAGVDAGTDAGSSILDAGRDGGPIDAGSSDAGPSDAGSEPADAATPADGGPDAGADSDASTAADAGTCDPTATPTIVTENATCTSGDTVAAAYTVGGTFYPERAVGQSFRVPRDGWLMGIEIAPTSGAVYVPEGAAVSLTVCEGASGRCPLTVVDETLASASILRMASGGGSCAGTAFSGTAPASGYADLSTACVYLRASQTYRFELTGGVQCLSSRCAGTSTFCSTASECGWGFYIDGTAAYADGATLRNGTPGTGDLSFRVYFAP